MDPKSSEEKMLQSISKELGVPNLLEILSTTPMRRLKPILIHAFKNRAKARKPTELLREYERRQEFLGIGPIAQDKLLQNALIFHETVRPVFESVQTSPIAPLGLNSVLSSVSQNNVLSTINDSEVVGAFTNQLALECSLRRKQKTSKGDCSAVHLSTAGRVLRLQPFDKDKGYMQHFYIFALCSGGLQTSSDERFATATMRMHIKMLLDVISALHKEGYKSRNITVKVSDIRFLEQLIAAQKLPREEIIRNSLNDEFDLFEKYRVPFPKEVECADDLCSSIFEGIGIANHKEYYTNTEHRLMAPLREMYPQVRFCFDFNRKAGLGYYLHLCFHIFASNQKGDMIQLSDGGAMDWAAKLLNNRKEVMVASVIGGELLQRLFCSQP
ncbi:MAG: hypothetical protein WC302_00625 [Candidatus Paceibacterota bacterium]|jgi:hypothetical protein